MPGGVCREASVGSELGGSWAGSWAGGAAPGGNRCPVRRGSAHFGAGSTSEPAARGPWARPCPAAAPLSCCSCCAPCALAHVWALLQLVTDLKRFARFGCSPFCAPLAPASVSCPAASCIRRPAASGPGWRRSCCRGCGGSFGAGATEATRPAASRLWSFLRCLLLLLPLHGLRIGVILLFYFCAGR